MDYTSFYRVGKESNFKWLRAPSVATKAEAEGQVETLTKEGFRAHFTLTSLLDTIGLPESFDL